MPACCVPRCKNRGDKIRLFRLPTGKENVNRRELWIKLIGNDDLKDNCKICEDHFSLKQFEQNRQDGRKLLRRDAVPDLLNKEVCSCTSLPQSDANILKPSLKAKRSFDNFPENVAATHSSAKPLEDYLQEENYLDDTFDPEVEELFSNNLLETGKQAEVMDKLRKALRKALHQRNTYKRQLEKKIHNFNNLFEEDQLQYIQNGHIKGCGVSWSDNTINKGLKLYLSCGKKGYEEIRKQNLPFPGIRTLQHRLRKLKFEPGILEDIFNLLRLKMENFDDHEKHAVLMVDEMAIKPGTQFDSSTSKNMGQPTMQRASGGFDVVATHALVFMLAGLSTRWKQTVAYELTSSSFAALEMVQKLKEILQKASDIGLEIKAVVSDMGGQNRGFWRLFNIVADRHSEIKNYITHPIYSDRKLFIIPDAVHLFKNVAAALTNGRKFYISQLIVDKYQLPSNEISIEPVKQVFQFDEANVLKLCPRLKKNVISPTHFEKMNVSLSVALLNHDVSAAILLHIFKGTIGEQHRTTAWFIEIMFKWFKLMTARHHTYAISHHKEEQYHESIEFLNSFINIVRNISTDDDRWKPFQTGLLLSTKTALDLQEIYLEKNMFDYLLLGRFTQDALENLFSTIRSRQPVPDARAFKVSLRLVSLSQFQSNIDHGNYEQADHHHVITYCNMLNDASVIFDEQDDCEDEDLTFSSSISNELTASAVDENSLSETSKAALYNLLGAVLHKIQKNYNICDNCFAPLLAKDEEPTHSLFVHYKEYKENLLFFPSTQLFKYIIYCELAFRANENIILNSKEQKEIFVRNLLENQQTLATVIPTCHKIMEKIVSLFIKCRVYFTSRENNKHLVKTTNAKSSRSVAMREAVKN